MEKTWSKVKDHRRMSEKELSERLAALQRPPANENSDSAREDELQAVLHELEVHQIELEMQNRELKESRQELEDSHNKYVNLYDFAPVGYVTLNDQGTINEINLTAAGMLGVERKWLMERSLAPWILNTDLALFRRHLQQCRENGGKVNSTLHLLRRDKRVIPVELSTSCLTDAASGNTIFRTAITDLTDKEKAEEDLDRFFNLSTDVLCMIGTDGYFKRVNPACEKLLGYTADELQSRPLFDFMHADDREASSAEFRRLSNEGMSTLHFQNRYVRKDRGVVWLSWNTITSGNTLYCVAREITAQVHAQEVLDNQHNWLKEMVRKIPLPLYLVEIETGLVVSMSVPSETLFFGFPRSASDASNSESFFADESGIRLPFKQWPRGRAANNEELNNEPFIWQTPLRTAHLLVSSRNIPDEYDRPAMAVIVAQDVTHLKEVEVSLLENVEKLEQERDLRERFVSTLTHDLRTPLTAAKMNIQLLVRRPEDRASTLKTSGMIIKSIDRVDHMIQDLLDANRIRAGENLPLIFDDFDLTLLATETLNELTVVHGNRFVLDAKGPLLGKWSFQGFRRVIENLINNAIKYGASNRPITISIAEDLDHRALISVHNFGNPIAKDDLPNIFQQYRRTSHADKGPQRGWGIGLTLVKGTVIAHGGEITVESSPNEGTTFRVVLPRECSDVPCA